MVQAIKRDEVFIEPEGIYVETHQPERRSRKPPLLLVHGYPETKRIWWRNIAALAGAGFEVIAPDLRGFGESGPAPDGFYDVALAVTEIAALRGQLSGLQVG